MELTKEECIEYLETLKNFACLHTTCCIQTREEINRDKKLFNECIVIFEQLITERFDNPPLKFEEFEEGMWVWIYRESAYRKILCTQTLSGVQFVIIDMSDNTERCIRFSSTEFYAREVKDEN